MLSFRGIPRYTTGMCRICVWGDSITWGAWDFDQGGWVARLRRHMDRNYPDGQDVYNVGVSADKVADVLRRFKVECEARNPAKIVIAIGINDSPRADYAGTDMQVFERDYRALIKLAVSQTPTVVLVGITNVLDDHVSGHGYRNETIKPYTETIRRLAAEAGLPYIDLWGVVTAEDLQLDGLHPEAAGHQKMAEKVIKALE